MFVKCGWVVTKHLFFQTQKQDLTWTLAANDSCFNKIGKSIALKDKSMILKIPIVHVLEFIEHKKYYII